MVRTPESLASSLNFLAEREKAFAKVLEAHGHPEPRANDPGIETLLRTIVGQQVSVAAARSMWNKLTTEFGEPVDLQKLLDASDDQMRAAGMSRQKAGYLRSLAGLVGRGHVHPGGALEILPDRSRHVALHPGLVDEDFALCAIPDREIHSDLDRGHAEGADQAVR